MLEGMSHWNEKAFAKLVSLCNSKNPGQKLVCVFSQHP